MLRQTLLLALISIMPACCATPPVCAGPILRHGATIHVEGRVLDPDGHPAANAKVTYVRFNLPSGSVVSAQDIAVSTDGSFDASVAYEPLAGGRPFVWIAESQSGICADSRPMGTQPVVTSTVSLVLHLVAKVSQTVKLTVDGKPAAHVKLQPADFVYGSEGHQGYAIWPKDYSKRWFVETDDEGLATITEMPSDYKVYFDVADERYSVLSYLNYYRISRHSTIDIGMDRPGSIVGRLTYPDGSPVVGARCRAESNRGYSLLARSDGSGAYHLDRLAPGTYTTSVADVGSDWAAPWDMQVTVTSGQSVSRDFAINHGAVVSGKVIDAKTGRPVAGVSVGPDGLDLYRNWVQTANDGSYRLRVCRGRGDLYVVGPGISVKKMVDPDEGSTLNIELRVEATPPLEPDHGHQ